MKIGDVVTLKSDPKTRMTIATLPDDQQIRAIWFHRGGLQSAWFHVDQLVIVPPTEPVATRKWRKGGSV